MVLEVALPRLSEAGSQLTQFSLVFRIDGVQVTTLRHRRHVG